MASKQVYLFMRPARRPKWWPRGLSFDGKSGWVGILAGGIGWVADKGDPIARSRVASAREAISFDFEKASFRIEDADK